MHHSEKEEALIFQSWIGLYWTWFIRQEGFMVWVMS